jgi:hypothetical protein
MEPESEEHIRRMQAKLEELGIQCVQPPNPYCATAILLGTSRAPEVVMNFWNGEPESVEFLRTQFPLKMIPRLANALEKAAGIIDHFPA